MMTTAALDLQYLTEAERDLILSVVRRDEELKNKDQSRINNLKSDIRTLKKEGALKPGMDAEKSCARCRESFGWILNRGELCPKCKQKVCENCHVNVVPETNGSGSHWICTLCKKQKDLDAMSGAWFYTKFRKGKLTKHQDDVISGTDLVKISFREKNSHVKSNGTQQPTTEEVRRSLAKNSLRGQTSSPDPEGESSDTQSMEANRSPRRYRKAGLHDAAFPKDAEKIMLLDLLGGPSVGPINVSSQSPEPLQPTVHVQRVTSRRYSDSSSECSDRPTSPQFSQRTESEYAPSESINSSFRSTSAISSDGRYNLVTDRESVISGISTAPPSMYEPESPTLSTKRAEIIPTKTGPVYSNSIDTPVPYADNQLDHQPQFVHSDYSVANPKNRHNEMVDDMASSSSQASLDSMPETLQYQMMIDHKHPNEEIQRVQTVKVVARGRSASESSSSDENDIKLVHGTFNNNNTKPYQTRAAASQIKEVPSSKEKKAKVEPSWVRSSGSDSSKTTKEHNNENSDERTEQHSVDADLRLSSGHGPRHSYDDDAPVEENISHYGQSDTQSLDHKNDTDTDQINERGFGSGADLQSFQGASSDAQSVKSDVKIERKSDSVVVKQDSVMSGVSASSGISVSITDTSSRDDISAEGEDDIDDLVTNFKKSKSKSKSQGFLHKPKHSNLTSSFSASVESVTSIYSEAGEGNYGNIPVEGEIQFGLDYNYKASNFEVNIKQCKDLAAVDTKKKRSDPYVKTYLLPDRTKNGKKKTRVRKHTLNPIFNDVIKYHIAKSELETRTLWVTVWNNDTFGKNDFLGEVTVHLDYYEFTDPSPKWYPLQERTPSQPSLLTYKGDINIALKYVTADNVSSGRKLKGKVGNKGELQVLVKEAHNLTAVRANGTSDPFCKAYLLPEKSKSSKQKTPVIKKNCNPNWNHTFLFEDISFEELKERALELTVWDHDRFTSNDFLGGVRLGLGTGKNNGKEVDWCDSKGEEISVWQSMLDKKNYWIEATLLLRPNMNSRKSAL